MVDKKIDHYIEAWYLRTLTAIDLDNGGEVIEPLTLEKWKKSVKKDVKKLIYTSIKLMEKEKNKRPLTKRQSQILNHIRAFSKTHNYMPSLKEIGDYFNLKSVSGIHQHLELLRKKGYLERFKNQSRGLVISSIPPSKEGDI